MAYEVPLHRPPVGLAAADLSTHQFKFAKVTGANAVNIATAGTDVVIGVIQNKPTSGQAVEVETQGTTKVVAGAAISAGAAVMPDASGRAVTATSTNKIQGVALEAAGGAGELVTVLLRAMGTL
jgi:hypothetical protein